MIVWSFLIANGTITFVLWSEHRFLFKLIATLIMTFIVSINMIAKKDYKKAKISFWSLMFTLNSVLITNIFCSVLVLNVSPKFHFGP